jgi:hypothetical protein
MCSSRGEKFICKKEKEKEKAKDKEKEKGEEKDARAPRNILFFHNAKHAGDPTALTEKCKNSVNKKPCNGNRQLKTSEKRNLYVDQTISLSGS